MVEVLERRAREPTGPIEAPPANRLLLRPSSLLPGDDLLISGRLLTDLYPDTGRVLAELASEASETIRKHVAHADFEHGGGQRRDASQATGQSDQPCEDQLTTRRVEDKWCWGKVVPLKRGVLTGRLEDRSEPGKGSFGRSETGERNVAKRRHGRPCGQQSMDEINGHCPQGEKASRFGLCRCRRFRCSSRCDHRQQRPGAQSVSYTTYASLSIYFSLFFLCFLFVVSFLYRGTF